MDLIELSNLCYRLKDLSKLKEQKEAELDAINQEIKQLSEVSIPCVLDELGVKTITLTSGEKITCELVIKASIPKDRADEAFKWLEDHGFQDLIKTTIKLQYDRGNHQTAAAVYNSLLSNGINATMDTSVNPRTLAAFAKEQLSTGHNLPFDLLGIYQFNRTNIK